MGNSTPSKSSLHWHFGIGDTTSYVFLRCKYFMYMQDLSINSNLCGREHLCPRNINSGTRTPTICKMRWILTLSIVGKFFSHDYTLCTSSNVLIPRTFLHMLARVTNFETVLSIHWKLVCSPSPFSTYCTILHSSGEIIMDVPGFILDYLWFSH